MVAAVVVACNLASEICIAANIELAHNYCAFAVVVVVVVVDVADVAAVAAAAFVAVVVVAEQPCTGSD